jgi:hypothetical protein
VLAVPGASYLRVEISYENPVKHGIFRPGFEKSPRLSIGLEPGPGSARNRDPSVATQAGPDLARSQAQSRGCSRNRNLAVRIHARHPLPLR